MIKNLTLKLLYIFAALKYPAIRKDYKYFIRDNYFCRVNQIKYFWLDYIRKEKYKVIEFQGEFDQELRYVLPFAYWHFLNGTLKKTVSSKNTKALYFFSGDHEERYERRIWQKSYESYEVPNRTHGISFSYRKWEQVPLKKFYKNSIFIYPKPILIIANKYNVEWDEAPLNFLDISTLDQIITRTKGKYQVIYNRPLSNQIVGDNSEVLDLNEYQWLRDHHADVLLMNDLYEKHRNEVSNFNQLQLMVYANCNHFISCHGGTAALASYFSGTNIILSKKGIEHDLNEFKTIFPALSGAKILHAKSENEVIVHLKDF